MDDLDKEKILEEYRQLMESQRDNTRIAYSWMGSIFLVLCSALFFFGLTTDVLASFIPAMVLGIFLCLIWVGLTETFASYTRQRFQRLTEIAEELSIPAMPYPKQTFLRLSRIPIIGYIVRCLPLRQARTYVLLFVLIYILVWILRLILGFLV
jgi:hypothetical protein